VCFSLRANRVVGIKRLFKMREASLTAMMQMQCRKLGLEHGPFLFHVPIRGECCRAVSRLFSPSSMDVLGRS
jgi:hypothetical protein